METKKRKRISPKKELKVKQKKTKKESDDEFEESEIPDLEDFPVNKEKTFLCKHDDSYHKFENDEVQNIQEQLLQWYDKNKRDLPWRSAEVKNDEQMDDEDLTKRGYAVWVSEIMLQQTRVQTVIDYYKKWMKKWPTIQDLAKASLEEVNEVWSGLGYYRRAKFLHEGAKMVVDKLKGKLPRTAKQLEEIPGIGKYTAGAIASIAFGKVVPLVDGNVVRVLSRLRAIGGDPKSKKAIQLHWKLAEQLVDPNRPGSFNQSLMELGATLCTAQNPSCSSCPVRDHCNAYKELEEYQDKQKESTPFQNKDKIKKEEEEEDETKNFKKCTICEDWEEVNTPTTTVMKYPRKVKKTAQREEWVAAYIMEFSESNVESQYLLVQRPSTGLLANLWEFPQILLSEDEKQDAEDEFSDQIQMKLDKLLKDDLGLSNFEVKKRKHVGSIVHLFSHIKQNIFVEHLQLSKYELDSSDSNRSTRWVSEDEMNEAAISKIVKKCFALKKNGSKKSNGKIKTNNKVNTKSPKDSKGQSLLTSFLVKK